MHLAEVDADGKINPDTGGNDTHLIRYDVFGGIRNYTEVADGESSHRFVGSLGHTSEGDGIISEGVKYPDLIYMQARYYDPAVGRFVSEDPAGDGANWYAYCGNNPINAIDITGECTGDINEPGIAAEGGMTAEGEAGSVAIQVYRKASQLIKALQKFNPQLPYRTIGDAVEAAKDWMGMGGADLIGFDAWGGMWTTTGEFIGFIVDFL